MFSKANAKTKSLASLANGGKVYSLDLPAGVTCPGAVQCKSWVTTPQNDGKRKIRDGKHCVFRCFAASQEALYPQVWEKRRRNYTILRRCRTPKAVCKMILKHLPPDAGVVRLHVSGDFFSKVYLRGVMLAAQKTPQVRWYAYTKSLHLFWDVGMQDPTHGVVTPNFFIAASRGGSHDKLIEKLGIRTAEVVFSEAEAEKLGLPIDHTDRFAATEGGSFALLLHGTQPKGSAAAKAWYAIRRQGGGYKR